MTPPIIDGVALDMDGLLFDTERLYFSVGQTILSRRGHSFSLELQQRMMGRIGLAAIAEMIAFHELDDDPIDLLAESDEAYAAVLVGGLQPMPGLETFIERLLGSGIPFGLATSSRRRFVDVILATVRWADRLAFTLTGDDVVHGKPHPEMYLRATAALAVEPGRMLVLEDSGNGAAAAVEAGAITVAIPNEHTRGQAFPGVAMIADSLVDPRLLGWLNQT